MRIELSMEEYERLVAARDVACHATGRVFQRVSFSVRLDDFRPDTCGVSLEFETPHVRGAATLTPLTPTEQDELDHMPPSPEEDI